MFFQITPVQEAVYSMSQGIICILWYNHLKIEQKCICNRMANRGKDSMTSMTSTTSANTIKLAFSL